MLAPVGDENLGSGNFEAGVSLCFKGNGLPQSGQTGRGGVLVVRRVGAGLDGRFHNVSRRREVGLTGAVANDGLAGGLQGLGFGIDGQRRRRRQSG